MEIDEELAIAIRTLAKAVEKLLSGPINRRTIILLIHDNCSCLYTKP